MRIRTASNEIYNLLSRWLLKDVNILTFSPSHLITKSILIAAKLNP